MFNSKAVQIMRSLSEDELRDFSRFVISPYFNRLKDVTGLFNILKNYYPEFNESELITKERAAKKLFPSKPYNDARMRNLVSDLGQLAEKFLFLKSREDESIYESHTYMNSLLNRKLYGVFEGALKRSERTGIGLNLHYKKSRVADLKSGYFQAAGKIKKSGEAVYEKHDSLVGFYMNSMVNGLFQYEYYKNLNGFEKAPSLMKEYFSSFDLKGFHEKVRQNQANMPQNEVDYLDMQYFFHEMLAGHNFEVSLTKLLELVNKYEKTMTQQEKHDIYSNISNVLAFKLYAEGLDHSNLQFMIFKEIIAKQAYFGDKRRAIMPVSMFLSGVDLALNQGQAGFIDFMLDSLVHITPSETRQSLVSYTKARLEFANKNFEASLAHLAKAEQKPAELKRHARGLELLLHYELGRFVSGKALAATFREELKKEGIFKGMYSHWYDNFLKFYGELLETRSLETNGKDFIEVKTLLNNTEKVLFRQWLLEKMG